MADTPNPPPPSPPPPRLFRVRTLLRDINDAEQHKDEGELPKDFDMPFVSLSTQVSTLPDGTPFQGAVKSLSLATPVQPLTRPPEEDVLDMIQKIAVTNNVLNPPPTIFNDKRFFDHWKHKAEVLRTAWELDPTIVGKEKYSALLQAHLAEGINKGTT